MKKGFGMPLTFTIKNHRNYLNPWVRYIEANVNIFVLDWNKEPENQKSHPKLNFNDFKFEQVNLTPEEIEGYQYWIDKFRTR